MTTSQIQRRLVDFRFYRIQPPHPSHGQALVTSLSPLSLTWFFFFFSPPLWKLNLTPRQTNTRTHFITHSSSVYSVQIAGVSAEMTSQIILGSFPWETQPPPTPLPTLFDLQLHPTHYCHHPPFSSSVISHFLFLRLSLTHTHSSSVTSLSVNIAFLSAWQS